MTTQIKIRQDTAANWTSNNPTLAQGEFGFETDTRKMKIGDGSTAWNSLSYFVSGTGWQVIQVQSVSAAANVTFSGIAASYAALRITGWLLPSVFAGNNILTRVNGDTGANYDAEFISASGTNISTGTSLAQTSWAFTAHTANINPIWMDLVDYAQTTYQKIVRMDVARKQGTAGTDFSRAQFINWWRSTAAINSVSFTPTSGTITAHLVLSGLKES